MKKHLSLLMVTIMVTVMSELQVAGMMPAMSSDLGVSTGQVGMLVSMFAAGMAIAGRCSPTSCATAHPRAHCSRSSGSTP